MGAVQGIIEFVGGLVLSAMVFVLLRYNFDTIERFCMGMGGFSADVFVFMAGLKTTILWLMVIILALSALLHSIGLNPGAILKKL